MKSKLAQANFFHEEKIDVSPTNAGVRFARAMEYWRSRAHLELIPVSQ
jgi:hypothetical protein